MITVYCSETAVYFYPKTSHHILGYCTLQSYLFKERYEKKHRNKDVQGEGREKQTETGRSNQTRMKTQTGKSTRPQRDEGRNEGKELRGKKRSKQKK
jgi:hypothetical protein